MTTIVIAPSNVVTFPEGGGHFWVYMQYVQGFLRQGCDVYWLEQFVSSGCESRDTYMLSRFAERMASFGLKDKVILYTLSDGGSGINSKLTYLHIEPAAAEAVFHEADLLLNFYYAMDLGLLAQFRRTALIDIDPGLLQFWISTGQIKVAPHDYYCTTGETVGSASALFPDCGLSWIKIRPPVSLESWPYSYKPSAKAFTTISGWWGGDGKGEFIADGDLIYENNKRVTFLQYLELPQHTPQAIELALNLGTVDVDEDLEKSSNNSTKAKPAAGVTDYISDAVDRLKLQNYGWHIKDPYEVANSPDAYRSYIQNSRGEFSCVKPSCLRFQNAWISDRTICYLASGRPVVVQDTGPSSFLPNGEGMFRFSTMDEAVDAFNSINSDYERHCRAAREIAETYFDSREIAEIILRGCQL
jgi:hypothetical protein